MLHVETELVQMQQTVAMRGISLQTYYTSAVQLCWLLEIFWKLF